MKELDSCFWAPYSWVIWFIIKLTKELITYWYSFSATWYFFLYNFATAACANKILWAAIYGSVDELPFEQLNGREAEQRWGGRDPRS